MTTAALILWLGALPRPGFAIEPARRPSIPEAPALAPKQPVALDLELAGDVTRPAPAPPPPRPDLRPRSDGLATVSPELREAALAILRGWLDRLELPESRI